MQTAALLCLALVGASFDRLATRECVGPRPPCEALAGADIVALVDVVEAAEPKEKVGADTRFVPQVVKLRVVERFKGMSPQQLEITGSIHYNAESMFLTAGKRYLFYAHKGEDGTWTTSCSRTKLVQDASAELRQLRRCVKK